MTESDEIEEILLEASAIGMRSEVITMASAIMKETPTIRPVEAYNQSYNYYFMAAYEKNLHE